MRAPTIHIGADGAPLLAALALLAEIAQARRELVEAFLSGLDTPSQLVRLDLDSLAASGAGELQVALQPSDLLVEFLSAARDW